jgi:hypothetical protein
MTEPARRRPPAVFAALDRLADVFSTPDTARQVGQAMTCVEADTLAHAMRVAGHADAADDFLRGHANGEDHGDDPGDRHYQLRDDYNPDRHPHCGDEAACLGCGAAEDYPRHTDHDED